MKLVTSYIALIVSVFLVSCGDTEAHFIPTPDVEEPEKSSNFVRLALDISPLPASTRSSIGIKDGYFFLVSKNEEGEMKLVERVYFDQDDLDPEWTTQGNVTIRYLKISINANPGKYLALVLANPTNEIKKTIENSETPWLETAEFSESHMKNPNGLERVMTNIIPIGKAWTQENLYPIIEVGSKEEGVIIPIGRVLSKISWPRGYKRMPYKADNPIGYSSIRIIELVNNKTLHIYSNRFGIVNLPNRFYLWPQIDDSNMPYSYYKGSPDDKNMINKMTKYQYFQSGWITNQPEDKDFYVHPIYIPENIATVSNGNNSYTAKRGSASAVVLRFTSTMRFYAVHPYGADRMIEYTPEVGRDDTRVKTYNKLMFLYFYIEDPNHKVNISGKPRIYPSVFRNTNYVIQYDELSHLGTVTTGDNLKNMKGFETYKSYDVLPNGDDYSLHSHKPTYTRAYSNLDDDPIITTE